MAIECYQCNKKKKHHYMIKPSSSLLHCSLSVAFLCAFWRSSLAQCFYAVLLTLYNVYWPLLPLKCAASPAVLQFSVMLEHYQWRIHIVARLARATPFRGHAANSGDRRESDYAVSEDA